MKERLAEFAPISYETWIDQLKKDLKDKSLDDLASNPEPDLSIVAYHHRDKAIKSTYGNGIHKMNNEWRIRQSYSSDEEKNELILAALNEGIDAIGLHLLPNTDFRALTKGILFEHIVADIAFEDLSSAKNFKAPKGTILNFDVLALNGITGTNTLSLNDFFEFYTSHNDNKSIWISGSIYGEAGASTVQELAFTLNHLNEYIHKLVEEGVTLAAINENIVVELSVNDNYFVNIAKFRVIHQLIAYLFKNYDGNYTYQPIAIYAKTNLRHLAVNDFNNNVLRETTQAMSAVIGGCDVLTISYLEIGNLIDRERTKRIAKNIQLILKEEAYLNQVVDPGHGAYFIESLSEQLIEKAWELCCEIESQGGLIEAMQKNIIHDQINGNRVQLIDDLLQKKKTFLGINKHPNPTEKWIDPSPIKPPETSSEFRPLLPFYLENQYLKTVKANG